MLGITVLHHVAVCVTDLERSKQFYGGVLGLREIARPTLGVEGTWYGLDNGQLHLIVHPPTRTQGTPPGRPAEAGRRGSTVWSRRAATRRSGRTLRGTTAIDAADGHLALRVGDYERALARLRAHGVQLLERPPNATAWKQVYFTDPDGNIIELNVDR